MQLISVNIGGESAQPKGEGTEITGIFKLPVQGPVWVTSAGIPGDFIGDREFHGGPDQAVYVYGLPDYDWWVSHLGRPLEPGTFGDNLTIGGLQSARLNVGDRLHIGDLVLEITAPRTPCSTLARRMGDPMFVRTFRRAELPGLYCRVIHEGRVQAGQPVHLEPYLGQAASVLELFREHYRREKNADRIRQYFTAPIAQRVRTALEEDLQRLEG
jgi:MOSC domain-containing protein YiiM